MVQGLEGLWKWSFETDGRTRSGVSRGTRQVGIRQAEYEIDRALAAKKIRITPPARGE